MTELSSRLGYKDSDRLVILSCGGLGFSHAATVGVYEALRAGCATTASLMVPCPWARHAAARYRGEDVGVDLTLNAELDHFRWGPITHAPSLLDGNGGLPTTVGDLWDHADLDEVRRECRAQIERAVLWGFDVSHIGSHLGALQDRPEFFDVALDLALEFELPMRLGSPEGEAGAGFPYRRLAADEGVLFPDYVRDIRRDPRPTLEQALVELEPGVTEIVLHPALDTPELHDLDPNWSQRVDALETVIDPGLRALVQRAGAVLVDYRTLRAAQRRAG